MTNDDFCRLAAQALTADMIDAGIVAEARASDFRNCLLASLQTAAQHALMGVRSRLAAAMEGINLMPEEDATDGDMVEFLTHMNHPDK